MYTLTQYLQTLENPEGLCRRLRGFRLLRNENGKIIYHVGNSAIVFPIEHLGRTLRLRCYKRPIPRSLRTRYGERLWEKELYLYTHDNRGEWVDVVIEEWCEGLSLTQAVEQALQRGDQPALQQLSERFDRCAAEWLNDEWAHGDLKPDNILVDRRGELRLIDFDGCYSPEWADSGAIELGTPTYQHPARTMEHFDRWLDHFPATLLSIQLRSLALDPSLQKRFPHPDTWLFSAQDLFQPDCPAFRAAVACLTQHADALHYRLAQHLGQPTHRLTDVAELFRFGSSSLPEPPGDWECYIERGLFGFRSSSGVETPPLYDEAFEFHEGWAAVRLADHWFYMDERLQPVCHLPRCEAVKSRRNGRIRYQVAGRWIEEPIRK